MPRTRRGVRKNHCNNLTYATSNNPPSPALPHARRSAGRQTSRKCCPSVYRDWKKYVWSPERRQRFLCLARVDATRQTIFPIEHTVTSSTRQLRQKRVSGVSRKVERTDEELHCTGLSADAVTTKARFGSVVTASLAKSLGKHV